MKTQLKSCIATFIITLVALLPLRAQNGKLYTTEQGLSSSLVNSLLQDNRGYIWMATEYGLNRFDGIRFTNYFHNEGDSTSLCSNYVHTLFEDSHHHLYVGCINGLMEYRRETDDFRRIPLMNGKNDVAAHVTRLLETPQGKLLVATTGQGLFVMDTEERMAHNISESWHLEDYAYIASIYLDKKDNVWIGTDGSGALRYSTATSTTTRYPQSKMPDDFIIRLSEDNEGHLFLGTLHHGLYRYHPENESFSLVKHATKPEEYSIMSLAQLDQHLLVGTDGQGLKIYDATRDVLEDYVSTFSPIDLSDAKVHAMLEDRDGNLWLGLFQKGVVLIPKKGNPFAYYGPKLAYYNPIGNTCVMSVYSDSRQHLWVGTDHDGLYELDAQGRRLRHLSPDKTGRSVPATIMGIMEDSEHRLWLSSYGQGLACLNPQSGQCEYLPQLANTAVMSVAEDPQKNLYIAASARGIYRYSLTDKSWEHYEGTRGGKGNPQSDELANNWVNRIFVDSHGRIWLAHYAGISCFDPRQRSFLTLNGKNLVVGNCIGYAFAEAQDGTLWAGTSEGLCSIHPETGEYTLLTTHDGLCNNIVGGICIDGKGHLWISTFRGMSQYDPTGKSFINYYAGDGLQGNDFTLGACSMGTDGRCYFGGVNGITTFMPAEIKDSSRERKVWITDFSVDNQSVNLHSRSNGRPIITDCLEDADAFRLSYLDNSFSLTFSTLQYDNADQISYQYRMDGINSQWISTEPGINIIRYNKLPYGTYTLRVRAVVRGEYSEERVVKIFIAAPWYRSGWAYALYLLLLSLAAFGVLSYLRARVRQKQQMLKQQQAEQINEAKLQFFINIAHEIRTPMTLIISPLEKLLASEQQGERYKVYQMIYRNAERILRLINQLMDVRKLDKGQMTMKFSETDMVDFISDGIQPFETIAVKKHISLQFHHEMEKLAVWVDLNNFDKVMMNLMSNAMKYTPKDGHIDVYLTTGTDAGRQDALSRYLEITIADSGIGLDETKIDHIFDRFFQIDNSVTKANAGTGVGLHLCRQLVILHHGTIHAANNSDGPGCRFTVRLPLGKDHLKPEEMEDPTLKAVPAVSKQFKPADVIPGINEDDKDNVVYAESAKRNQTQPLLLIAEDDEEIAHYLREELKADYRVTTCCNGKEALNSALRRRPDLIISDVMMPEMDGLTLCHKLKQNTEINHVPVILLTAKSRQEDRREGMEQGADAFITKPFSIDMLRTTITNLLDNRRLLRTKYSGSQQQQDKMEHLEMKSGDEQLMERIMKVINKHLDNPELSVEMLSTEVGISRVHIHRKLKELTNMTTRDFIKNIRLQQAATLMTENEGLTVSDIAYKVGFSNLSHFSTSFKEKFGRSPKDYMTEKHPGA